MKVQQYAFFSVASKHMKDSLSKDKTGFDLQIPFGLLSQLSDAYFIVFYMFREYILLSGVLNRCTHVRVNGQRIPLTQKITQKIVDQCIQYGTGRDTLRCLALGTIDSPSDPRT